jgi:hypothetical protein
MKTIRARAVVRCCEHFGDRFRIEPELRSVIESSRAETVALLLGEDLVVNKIKLTVVETSERFLFSEI